MTQEIQTKEKGLKADAEQAGEAPCKGEAVAELLDGMENRLEAVAANLYNLASMLLGEGEEALTLVERTLASPKVTGCCDTAAMEKSARKALCAEGVQLLAARQPGAMAAPAGLEPMSGCIDDDDLSAAGVTGGGGL